MHNNRQEFCYPLGEKVTGMIRARIDGTDIEDLHQITRQNMIRIL